MATVFRGHQRFVSQSGERLKISTKLKHHALLVKELEAFRVKINVKTAHDSYEAWREGDHDDLVLSVALCCWFAERPRKKMFEDEATQEKAPLQQAAGGRVEIHKINEVHEEIIVYPPTEEERHQAQEGWTWNDLLRNGR